jgi:hypothetical protein
MILSRSKYGTFLEVIHRIARLAMIALATVFLSCIVTIMH